SAYAVLSGSTSVVDQAEFHIAGAQPLGCCTNGGCSSVTAMLATTNQPSMLKGSGHYAARYSINGRRGDEVWFTVLYQEFDASLSLTDPNHFVVAQSDDQLNLGLRPALY